MRDRHPLDNPARSALLGPHAGLALRRGQVLRYPVDVCPFVALPDLPDEDAWRDAADLLGPGAVLPLAAVQPRPPSGWETVFSLPGVQLVDQQVHPQADPDVVALGPADVPEMLSLVERTRPGPFLARTVELGGYLGIRLDGKLVAMAGQRLRPPGWTEISAVCTDPEYRRRGLAGRLTRAVAADIRARGDIPFLHTTADNADAIRLYDQLGFRLRRRIEFTALRVPCPAPVG